MFETSIEKLAEAAGVTPKTIQDRLKDLERLSQMLE